MACDRGVPNALLLVLDLGDHLGRRIADQLASRGRAPTPYADGVVTIAAATRAAADMLLDPTIAISVSQRLPPYQMLSRDRHA